MVLGPFDGAAFLRDRDLAGLRRAVQPVYDQLEANAETRSLLQRIQAMKHESRATATPDAPACAPSASATGAADQQPTPLDGVYRTSFTREELANSPHGPGEVRDDNWGDFTLTFDRRRVTFTQRNDAASYSTSGTDTVDGKAVTLRFTEGANADETFSAHWSLYRDVLTFERLGELPTPYLVKPWHRVR